MLEKIYSFFVSLDKKLTKTYKLPHPVISVGNISVGGRAKTPLVIDLVGMLREKSYEPVVLTRGYGRLSSEPHVLGEDSKDIKLNPDMYGDEPLEIFLKTGATVIVGPNRAQNAQRFLERRKSLDNSRLVFILDDGFQHWALKRDLDIVVVAKEDYSAKLLPFGNLREGVSALERAHLVLELEKSLKKKTSLSLSTLPTNEGIYALCTRAGKQGAYFESLKALVGAELKSIDLRDHSSSQKLKSQLMRSAPDLKCLLVGWKEAVKLLSSTELQKHLPSYKLSLENKTFDVVIVNLALEWDRESFWRLFKGV
jgi:tetraacyldisaccharide-1-P 4'-kinase